MKPIQRNQIKILKKMINILRDIRKQTINSDDLNDEQRYFLQEGFREGLCAAALELAEEIDALYSDDPFEDNGIPDPFNSYWEQEECWWHTHTDEDGSPDIGTEERL